MLKWTFNSNPHLFIGNLTHFSAKSGSQNTDSRESPSSTFLKITPSKSSNYTTIEVHIPPFPKPHTTPRQSPSHTPRHNSNTHTPAKPLRETVAAEPYPLFRVLRHRILSSPICLAEAIRKPFALSRAFLLSSGGKSALLVNKKAPSRSGILYLCT